MQRKYKEPLYKTSYVVGFLALILLVNVVLSSLASRFSWYFYTEEQYHHEISGVTERMFSETEEEVEIIFCMAEETMLTDPIYSLVYNTALQLKEKHSFLKIKIVNIFLDPQLVSKYAYAEGEDGELVKIHNIKETSVIFASGEESRVEDMESFFFLDQEDLITGYNGEEVMAACVGYVLEPHRPVAGFTHTHGESIGSAASLYAVLLAAGYEIRLIDLEKEAVPEEMTLIVSLNPLYDFSKAAEGSGIVAECEALTSFLDRGGRFLLSLDPYGKGELTHLTALLSSRGLTPTGRVIRDGENSITADGYTVIADYVKNGEGGALYETVSNVTDSRVILREAAVIECAPVEGYTVSPLLLSSASAVAYENGAAVDASGSFAILASSRAASGGEILLSSCVYLMASDAMNSAVYANRPLVMALVESNRPAPIGCRILSIGNSRLEDMTMSEAGLWTALLVGVLPLGVAAAGAVILVRRKHR